MICFFFLARLCSAPRVLCPTDHGALLRERGGGGGRGVDVCSALPLFMFLVLGTDYVDVAFSADGLLGFGTLEMGFVFFFLMMREGTWG